MYVFGVTLIIRVDLGETVAMNGSTSSPCACGFMRIGATSITREKWARKVGGFVYCDNVQCIAIKTSTMEFDLTSTHRSYCPLAVPREVAPFHPALFTVYRSAVNNGIPVSSLAIPLVQWSFDSF